MINSNTCVLLLNSCTAVTPFFKKCHDNNKMQNNKLALSQFNTFISEDPMWRPMNGDCWLQSGTEGRCQPDVSAASTSASCRPLLLPQAPRKPLYLLVLLEPSAGQAAGHRPTRLSPPTPFLRATSLSWPFESLPPWIIARVKAWRGGAVSRMARHAVLTRV